MGWAGEGRAGLAAVPKFTGELYECESKVETNYHPLCIELSTWAGDDLFLALASFLSLWSGKIVMTVLWKSYRLVEGVFDLKVISVEDLEAVFF